MDDGNGDILPKSANQTKPIGKIFAGDVAMRGLQWNWCCNHCFRGRGDEAVVVEIIMVQKRSDVFFYLT